MPHYQERSATNCLKNKVLRALRNESREVIEVRLGEESSIEGPTVGKCRFSISTIGRCPIKRE